MWFFLFLYAAFGGGGQWSIDTLRAGKQKGSNA